MNPAIRLLKKDHRLASISREMFCSLRRDRGQTLLPPPYPCTHFDTGVDRVATQQRHVENLTTSKQNDIKKSRGEKRGQRLNGKSKSCSK